MSEDGNIAVLCQQAAGAGHLKSSVLKVYDAEQVATFVELLPAWRKDNLESYGQEVRAVMTGRAEARLRTRFSEQSRRLEEAAQLVRQGISQNPSDARAYDARDVVSVQLDRCGWLSYAGGVFLLIFVGAILPALAIMAAAWLMNAMMPYASWWPLIIPMAVGTGGYLLILGVAMIPVTMILRALRGRPVLPDFRLDHRVRIRFSNGRRETLMRTPRHVVAIEFYNLVVRDIRRLAE